jgi:hypothetical protein
VGSFALTIRKYHGFRAFEKRVKGKAKVIPVLN